MFAWHTGLRTRIPAYVSAYSYVRMQVWHSSVYPWAYAAFRKRVEFGSHVSYGKGGHRRGVYRSDPRYEKRRWGGGLYASDPLSTPVRYTYSMVKVISLWGVEPSTPPPPPPPPPPHPPLRRIRHVVTQWYVLLLLIMCAYGLAVYNVK